MIISGKIWALYAYDEPNDDEPKPWKTTPVPVHTAYCNFKY